MPSCGQSQFSMNATTNTILGRAAWRVAQASLISGGLAFLAGCASGPESHVVSAPPPPAPQTQVVVSPVVQQPVTTAVPNASGGAVIVTQAPPAVQQEMVSAQPTSDHKWVPGYWTWRNSRYEWVAGHWELPPRNDAVWIAPRWERTSSGAYRFYEGYWD